MMFLLLIPDNEEMSTSKNTESKEQIKAVTPGLSHRISRFNSMQIDTAAPKADAADIPNVKGEARELSRIICMIAPARPRQLPAVIAITISGRRIFNST